MASTGKYDASLAVHTFGRNSYHQLTSTAATDNIVSSPLSILFAVLLTYIGAEGQTKKQIEQTIQANSTSRNVVLEGYTSIMRDLFQRTPADHPSYELTIANNIFVDKRFPLQTPYFEQSQRYLGVRGEAHDFKQDAENVRKRINQWAAQQTKDKIKEAVPSGMIDQNTVMMLVNAIHFKSAWAKPFDTYFTKDKPFKNLDNSQVTVPTMENTAKFQYFHNEQKGFQYIELPYADDKNTMVIVLPDASKKFQEFEKSLDSGSVRAAAQNAHSRRIHLVMPKFKFEKEYDVKELLSALGMPRLFSNEAELPGISTLPTKVSKAIHKAFIDVNEAGTEAAAVTSMAVELRASFEPYEEPLNMVIDRPFLFAIRNNEKKVLLFNGRVAKL